MMYDRHGLVAADNRGEIDNHTAEGSPDAGLGSARQPPEFDKLVTNLAEAILALERLDGLVAAERQRLVRQVDQIVRRLRDPRAVPS